MFKLQNGRIEVGPDEEKVLQEELKIIDEKLAILKPIVENDIRESREKHRKLWGYN